MDLFWREVENKDRSGRTALTRRLVQSSKHHYGRSDKLNRKMATRMIEKGASLENAVLLNTLIPVRVLSALPLHKQKSLVESLPLELLLPQRDHAVDGVKPFTMMALEMLLEFKKEIPSQFLVGLCELTEGKKPRGVHGDNFNNDPRGNLHTNQMFFFFFWMVN